MLFKYKATTPDGEVKEGTMEAASSEIAVGALQKRNLIIVSLHPVKEKKPLFSASIGFHRLKKREIVIFSRQLSTLFEAKVPVLTAFKLLSAETDNNLLKSVLVNIVEDLEGGATISQAMVKHPKVFSSFFINMVRAGEESGKLDEVFLFMADYMERSYELTSKATRALVYPAFVVSAFIAVLILMIVVVIPKLAEIIKESGQEAPIYTKAVLGLSDFFINYGIFILVLFLVGLGLLWRYAKTKSGKIAIHRFQLNAPLFGTLYKKLYLSRIADNMETLISGGVSVVESLEITAEVVGNEVYKYILLEALESVKGGSTISESLARYEEIPTLVSQMIRIGEETGKLGYILKTTARFYRREVDQAIESLVGLIEPAMIIVLGVGVGLLLASVLVPIYNIALSV